METYYDETLELIARHKSEIADRFENECLRLLKSGAIDRENHQRGVLFGVALENLAESFTRFNRSTQEYKNLKNF